MISCLLHLMVPWNPDLLGSLSSFCWFLIGWSLDLSGSILKILKWCTRNVFFQTAKQKLIHCHLSWLNQGWAMCLSHVLWPRVPWGLHTDTGSICLGQTHYEAQLTSTNIPRKRDVTIRRTQATSVFKFQVSDVFPLIFDEFWFQSQVLQDSKPQAILCLKPSWVG